MTLRLATWNINSVRLRIDLVKRLAEEENPDILCLQETKTPDDAFPQDAVRQMGFPHIAFAGQKGYNGVAILSKQPLTEVREIAFLENNEEKRHIMATLPDGTVLHNFYVPAGGDIPDPQQNPKFDAKLRFVDAMQAYFAQAEHKGSRTIMVGDMNIAPQEHDVWSHKQLLKIVSHTPIEVEKLNQVLATQQWIDTARHNVSSTEKIYSWWSYRNRDWKKSDRGRRLDHIWITPALKDALAKVTHIRHVRDWERTSDHVPVIVDLKLDMP